MNQKLKEAITTYNELLQKFNKSFEFFEKYANYHQTNPKDFKILEKKIEGIVREIGELDWINDFKNQFTLNSDLTISLLRAESGQQVKLF